MLHSDHDWYFLDTCTIQSQLHNVSSTSWRVLPFVHCRAWCRITLLTTVSWLPILDGVPCGPLSDVSALCHITTALSAIDPSRLPVRTHGTSCCSVSVTLGYRWLPLMHTWRHTYSPLCVRPQRICDIYDFFAAAYKCTYLVTYLHSGFSSTAPVFCSHYRLSRYQYFLQ